MNAVTLDAMIKTMSPAAAARIIKFSSRSRFHPEGAVNVYNGRTMRDGPAKQEVRRGRKESE
jgi:hypothetical protein